MLVCTNLAQARIVPAWHADHNANENHYHLCHAGILAQILLSLDANENHSHRACAWARWQTGTILAWHAFHIVKSHLIMRNGAPACGYGGSRYTDTPIWVLSGGGPAGAPQTPSSYNFLFFLYFLENAALHPGYCGTIH